MSSLEKLDSLLHGEAPESEAEVSVLIVASTQDDINEWRKSAHGIEFHPFNLSADMQEIRTRTARLCQMNVAKTLADFLFLERLSATAVIDLLAAGLAELRSEPFIKAGLTYLEMVKSGADVVKLKAAEEEVYVVGRRIGYSDELIKWRCRFLRAFRAEKSEKLKTLIIANCFKPLSIHFSGLAVAFGVQGNVGECHRYVRRFQTAASCERFDLETCIKPLTRAILDILQMSEAQRSTLSLHKICQSLIPSPPVHHSRPADPVQRTNTTPTRMDLGGERSGDFADVEFSSPGDSPTSNPSESIQYKSQRRSGK